MIRIGDKTLFGWKVAGVNVACDNCTMPVYRPKDHGLCPACLDADSQDAKTSEAWREIQQHAGRR